MVCYLGGVITEHAHGGGSDAVVIGLQEFIQESEFDAI
jgi:hypothetical protein